LTFVLNLKALYSFWFFRGKAKTLENKKGHLTADRDTIGMLSSVSVLFRIFVYFFCCLNWMST